MILAVAWFREPSEPLTIEALSMARQRWQAANIHSYDVRYKMNNDLYEVSFRDGAIATAKVNNTRPTTSNLDDYSIEGLFNLLEMELENMTDPAGPFAASAKTVFAKVRFHESLGYVEYYIRSSGGQGRGAVIEMLQFERNSR